MEKHRIPCVYYPSTCVIVDDQKTFLDNIIFKIDPHSICKTFSDPHEALEYIKKSKKNEFLSRTISSELESPNHLPASGETPLIHINTSNLYKHVYEKNRFSEVSVIVVDFQMPIMNGAEFCRELQIVKESPIKIIMLTGEADEQLAVQLFNEGIIQQFIRKGAPNVYELLNHSIKEMQSLYFQACSDSITAGLSVDQNFCMNDPVFVDIFEETYKKLVPSSYYLIEPSGSYIFIDGNNIPTWLIIKTQSELNDFSEQMQDFDIEADLVNKVREGALIPYFYNFDHCMTALEKKSGFAKYLFPAKKIPSTIDFSYSIITKLPEFPLELDKIMSFKNFIAK